MVSVSVHLKFTGGIGDPVRYRTSITLIFCSLGTILGLSLVNIGAIVNTPRRRCR